MEDDLNLALKMVSDELRCATEKFDKFNSAHEGYAVTLEELDEVWEAIKNNDIIKAKIEMIQVAAMAIRFVLDV